jgi:hypothetical protein
MNGEVDLRVVELIGVTIVWGIAVIIALGILEEFLFPGAADGAREVDQKVGDVFVLNGPGAKLVVGGAKFRGHARDVATVVLIGICCFDLRAHAGRNRVLGERGEQLLAIFAALEGAAKFFDGAGSRTQRSAEIAADGSLRQAGAFVELDLIDGVLLEKDAELRGKMGHGLCV